MTRDVVAQIELLALTYARNSVKASHGCCVESCYYSLNIIVALMNHCLENELWLLHMERRVTL